MNDYLVQLAKKPIFKTMIEKMGLPKLPPALKRSTHPWEQRPFDDQNVMIGQMGSTQLTKTLAEIMVKGGAIPYVEKEEPVFNVFYQAGDAYGRKAQVLKQQKRPSAQLLIYDATNMNIPEELNRIFSFFYDHIRSLDSCGRLIILSRPPCDAENVLSATTTRALEGFIRAMAREIGFMGATANIVYVHSNADYLLEPALRFFLSKRSAYITGQPIYINSLVKTDKIFPDTRPLDGKTALITGAAQGIGAAIARSIAREGARVIIMDRPEADVSAGKLASEIDGSLFFCDISSSSADDRMADWVTKRFGGLDIVVHNAGITRDKLLVNMKQEQWEQVLDVNLYAILRLNEKLIPMMRNNGRMVYLSSVSGIAGNRGQTNYSTSKAGIIGYVSAMSKELADKGIAVNAVAPGFIETQMTARIPFATQLVARRLNNLNQGGLPEDVAETVTFLSSPGAAGLTGQVIRVCGGALIGA
jgi:3-oxoacyl-[acyl-carrier protein] reductase